MDPISNDLQHVVVVGLSHDSINAYVVSLVLEALLLGTFTVTYTLGACSLLTSLALRRRSRDWVLLGTSTAMFGLALAHLVLSLKLTFAILPTIARNDGPCDSTPLLETTTVFPMWYFRLGIYVTQTLIGDIFMIYRLFLVWNRSRTVMVLPAILCLVNGVCGYLTLGPLTTTVTLLAFLVLSFVSNVLCSVLIIWRVFRSANQYTPLSARLKIFQKVAEAIVQSAAIYSTASVALALTFFFNPHNAPGFLVCLDVFPPLTGLVFSFIILRMARGSAEDAARLSLRIGNGGADQLGSTILPPRSRPMSGVRLHIPPFPPPALHLATFTIPKDVQATDGCNAKTCSSVSPAALLMRNHSSLAEDRDLERVPGEDDFDVLDIRVSKVSWNV